MRSGHGSIGARLPSTSLLQRLQNVGTNCIHNLPDRLTETKRPGEILGLHTVEEYLGGQKVHLASETQRFSQTKGMRTCGLFFASQLNMRCREGNAHPVTGFKTFIPDFDHDMVEKTVVYMAYDAENLYFAYRCFDSQPHKIKSSITARDNVRPDDWVCLNLDSFNDQQGLYAFYVNPAGIQGDSRSAAGREDYSVDVVWYSSGQIDSLGYAVEIQIPLKSIRYSDKNPVEMHHPIYSCYGVQQSLYIHTYP